jgi:hypothetical protein
MKNRRSTRGVYKAIDQIPTEDLLARLSPAARRRYLDSVLADDFSAFVMKVFETVSPGDEFRPNWHIDGMTYAAELVIDGKIKRLITTVPPRHLKSIIFSVALPAFLLGQDPTKRIICVSYIAKAAEACALAGSVAEGVSVSMDIEQLICGAGRLQDAASLLNRLSRE